MFKQVISNKSIETICLHLLTYSNYVSVNLPVILMLIKEYCSK